MLVTPENNRRNRNGVVVQRFFQVARLSLTHAQIIGYVGFGFFRSQHVESCFVDPVSEVLACQGALSDAARGIPGQIRRRLHPKLGG